MGHTAQTIVVALIVAGTAGLMVWRVFGLFGRKSPGCDHCPAKKD